MTSNPPDTTTASPVPATSGPDAAGADGPGDAAAPAGGRLPSTEAERLAEQLSGLAVRLAEELAARDADDPSHVLQHLAAVVDATAAAQIAAVRQAQGSEATIEKTGLPVEAFLRMYCSRTGSDARMVAMAADVLEDMPQTFRLLVDGTLTWGTIRAIVLQLSKAPRDERVWVDGELSADVGRLEDLGADGIVGVVDRLVAEAAPGEAERLEERARRGRFASIQGRLDRTGQLYADGPLPEISEMWANISGEVARQDQLGRNNREDGDGGGGGGRSWRTAGRRNFDALYTLLTGRHIDGGHATLPHRPDRTGGGAAEGPGPCAGQLDAVVDVRRLAWFNPAGGHTWAQLLTPLIPGILPLTPKSLARRADDLQLQVVLLRNGAIVGVTAPEDRPAGTRLYVTVEAGQVASLPDGRRAGWPGRITNLCGGTVWMTPEARQALDEDDLLAAAVAGARILTLGSESPTTHIGPALKAALLVRDGGCRAPGCSIAAAHTQAHHIRKRREGGTTVLSGLISLCQVHHTAIDKHKVDGKPGWKIDLDADGDAGFGHAATAYQARTLPRHKRRIDPTTEHPSTRDPPRDGDGGRGGGRLGRAPPDDDLPF